MLKEDLTWEMVNTQVPIEIHGHCAVQINDCEVALIGGNTGLPPTAAPSSKIYIYNFKSNEWRERDALLDPNSDPPEPLDLYGVSCAKVMEKTTGATKILFGFGENLDTGLWEWELSSDRFNKVWKNPGIPPGKFKSLDENTIVSVHEGGNVARSTASVEEYIKILNPNGQNLANNVFTAYFDFFILPRKETQCKAPLPPPPGDDSGENQGGGGPPSLD